MLMQLRQAMADLEDLDWREAEQGLYPKSGYLICLGSTGHPLSAFILILLRPGIAVRAQCAICRIMLMAFIPITASKLPSPNRWLPERPAELYDLQVDILFNGAAAAMRGV